MEAEQRPWVGLEKFDPSSGLDKGFDFFITIKNTGKSPALKAHSSFTQDFIRADAAASAVPQDCSTNCSYGLLLPGGGYRIKMRISSEQIKRAATSKPEFLYVIGRVDYEDAANYYWTTMCGYYDPDLESISLCGPGIADEGTKKKSDKK